VGNVDVRLWLAYCYFHAGEYRKAIIAYDDMMKKPDYDKNLHTYKGVCYYALTQYEEAKREAMKGPESPLQVRLLYHVAQKKGDETAVMTYHYKLTDSLQDQLCLAAIHYLRGYFEDAIEIYKKVSLDEREHSSSASNVYSALCFYKQEYYEVAKEGIENYLKDHGDSIFVNNLKACNSYQLYQGKVAEDNLKDLEKLYQGGNLYEDHDILRHNLCVFRKGENALQVFPPLIDLFPEARLNLVIYYLRTGSIEDAQKYTKDLDPFTPREYMLKGVVFAILGQMKNNREFINQAMQLFQMVGTSPTECDTIPGRQCVASYLFLKKQFENVCVYLTTIKQYLSKDDDFNWNYGIALACTGKFEEAEECLTAIESPKYRSEFVYLSWLARTFIMNGKPDMAWKVYMDMDTSNDAITLLKYVANDCYRSGFFPYALKCFDILTRLDSDADNQYYLAKIGSAVGKHHFYLRRVPDGHHSQGLCRSVRGDDCHAVPDEQRHRD
jgi:intraflagellar transport protein 56